MSKLVIFLCAALTASAVNASYVSDALASAEATVDGLIAATIDATEQKLDDTKSKVAEHAHKLEADAQSAVDKAMLQVKVALDQALIETDKLASKDEGSEITDCNYLVTHLINSGFVAIVKMSGCLNDKIATGNGYVQNIFALSENVLANLTAIREEAHHCGDNVNDSVDDIDTAVTAIKCVDMAGLKAAWVETMVVPILKIEMTKITNSFATLQASLAYCSTINEFDTFYHESSTVVESAKQCIHQRRHEDRPRTEEVTTEKASSSETTPNTEDVSA